MKALDPFQSFLVFLLLGSSCSHLSNMFSFLLFPAQFWKDQLQGSRTQRWSGSSCYGPKDQEWAWGGRYLRDVVWSWVAWMRMNKVRLDPWFTVWESEEIRCSEVLGGKLKEGPAGTESSKDQNTDPDTLALSPAILEESSSSYSQPHCCHYRGDFDVTKEGRENKITWKVRGW